MTLQELNCLPAEEARQAFLDCCASQRWAARMAAGRPYPSRADLNLSSSQIWTALSAEDWLEAFAAHPKIGGTKSRNKTSQTSRRWSTQEQNGVHRASEKTLQQLAQLNLEYQETFGYVFLVCATGKTALEILHLLRERLENDGAEELRIAANEQRLITSVRLEKMLTRESDS